MGSTGLVMAQSTRPLLPGSPRFEQALRARAQPYDLGRTIHTTGWRHSRLFLVYSLFIGFLYLSFALL